MVHNIKAGIAATASLAGGAAVAYKNGNGNNNKGNYQTQLKTTSQGTKNGSKKLHDDAMTQMQMWKF